MMAIYNTLAEMLHRKQQLASDTSPPSHIKAELSQCHCDRPTAHHIFINVLYHLRRLFLTRNLNISALGTNVAGQIEADQLSQRAHNA